MPKRTPQGHSNSWAKHAHARTARTRILPSRKAQSSRPFSTQITASRSQGWTPGDTTSVPHAMLLLGGLIRRPSFRQKPYTQSTPVPYPPSHEVFVSLPGVPNDSPPGWQGGVVPDSIDAAGAPHQDVAQLPPLPAYEHKCVPLQIFLRLELNPQPADTNPPLFLQLLRRRRRWPCRCHRYRCRFSPCYYARGPRRHTVSHF